MSKIAIYYKKSALETIRFSARELKRCLEIMTGVSLDIRPCTKFPDGSKPSICIGESSDFGNPIPSNALDDEIFISQSYGFCMITGSNPRSVLFAVYELLEKFGARWVGPGKEGEYLPEAKLDNIIKIDIHHRASYRHRSICIEGAPSVEHTIDMIDWMAKKRMNTFFLQFKTSFYFWRKWYSHSYNERFMKPVDIDESISLEMDKQVIKALKKRGLILQQVGHGWTAESIGLKGIGWDRFDGEVTPQQKALMAEVNGERGLFHNVPINTELCYSNNQAYDGLVNHVVEYASEHKEIDCLHFWLSDAPNNFCECPECRKLSQSDHYVKLVKAVSKKLKEMNIKTRIIFLCYTNTISPPIIEKIEKDVDNHVDNYVDNLIFMFAPISRCYIHPLTYKDCESDAKIDGWELNKIQPPHTNAEFVEILKKWQERYDCDSFLFDYYLWRPLHDYLNPLGLARIIHKDIQDLMPLGLNGLLSCQIIRCFYPVALVMDVMAETLWDRNVQFSDIIKESLDPIFENETDMVQKYFEELNQILSPESGHVGTLRFGNAERMESLIALLDKWEPYISSLSDNAKNAISKRYSYNLLHYHKLLRFRALSRLCEVKGEKEKASAYIDEMIEYLKRTERRTHRHFDTWMEMLAVGRI
jgi:hypothetical protein